MSTANFNIMGAAGQGAITGKKGNVDETISGFRGLFDEKKGGLEQRKTNYMPMVNNFYDMVTDIYEYGWGQSFHFAPRNKSETFETSVFRHEVYLAHKMEMKRGTKYIDIGCGVGAPGRAMARVSEAHVVGINNNEYQIEKCRKYVKSYGPADLCSYVQSDFMNLSKVLQPESLDGAFHVEAMCHAPDKVAAFKEVFKVLKPGALFGGYDWVVTHLFDPNNEVHQKIKKGIELGNSLPELPLFSFVIEALKTAGFEVIEHRDLAADFSEQTDIPWYDSLDARYTDLKNFPHTTIGMWVSHQLIRTMETLRLAPKGTTSVHDLLVTTAKDLVAGGKTGTFTPMYFFLARKPLNNKK
eukprot:TRINITY_DN4107_c0_g2_i3.p1 TRINITY_DN4107_c0_g2~~TRINITY_DN4107_c0_g2_i3.p1  ORF type:complete len:355 (+),score=121.79 TRINITY_DN4107_c0_g2_i3:69-1133(+)